MLGQILCLDSSRSATHYRPAIGALKNRARVCQRFIEQGHSDSTPTIFTYNFWVDSLTALRPSNLVFTTNRQAALDNFYKLETQEAVKKRFHSLQAEARSQ